jgi:modulator of FtsH protease HflK
MNEDSFPNGELESGDDPSLVPSPPSSGERVRVRGPSREQVLDLQTSSSASITQQVVASDDQSTLNAPSNPNPLSAKTGGEGTRKATRGLLLTIVIAAYFATGFFTVPANEVAVVRRFGRAAFPARTSGLRFDLPWPFVSVDRINLNAIRTLTLGEAALEPNAFLQAASTAPTTFLTGDKNLLQLRVVVQYRVSGEFLADWLYACEQPEHRLRLVVETTVADLVSRSGVDFVHTQGLSELNNRLRLAVRTATTRQRLGCEIDQVTIDRADPPSRVKAEFLDVSNARADSARSIHDARSYAEKRLAESQADARQLTDSAEQSRQTMTSAARGTADRFLTLIEQLTKDAISSGRSYSASRSLTMNRLYRETLRDVLTRAKSKVILDGQQPADIAFPRDREVPRIAN